jgi:hypothetical protein
VLTESPAVVVGQQRVCAVSVSFTPRCTLAPEDSESSERGVIHADDEDPLPLVRGTHVGRSQACPCDTKPAFGQVAENWGQSPRRSDPGDVFQDDDARS